MFDTAFEEFFLTIWLLYNIFLREWRFLRSPEAYEFSKLVLSRDIIKNIPKICGIKPKIPLRNVRWNELPFFVPYNLIPR